MCFFFSQRNTPFGECDPLRVRPIFFGRKCLMQTRPHVPLVWLKTSNNLGLFQADHSWNGFNRWKGVRLQTSNLSLRRSWGIFLEPPQGRPKYEQKPFRLVCCLLFLAETTFFPFLSWKRRRLKENKKMHFWHVPFLEQLGHILLDICLCFLPCMWGLGLFLEYCFSMAVALYTAADTLSPCAKGQEKHALFGIWWSLRGV